MTPAEQYAQKRAQAVALIREHAPLPLQQSLIDLLRPAIALNATRRDDDAIAIGASKFGGAPDAPAGFEWPTWNERPLGFLAQINLEEVAPFDVENLLPASGLLSFFYSWEDWQGTGEDICRVIWIDSTQIMRLDERGMNENFPYPSLISFEPFYQFGYALEGRPQDDKDELLRLTHLPDGPLNPYALEHPETLTQILGYGNSDLASSRSEAWHSFPWQLLFQMYLPDIAGEYPGSGEVFLLDFSISMDDLREQQFNQVEFGVGNS